MPGYPPENPERDAFFAALGRVFAEHRPVSENFAIARLDNLAALTDRGRGERVGVHRDDTGRIAFSDNPIADEIGDECVVIIPDFTAEALSGWECIVYLTS